jgi:hypothetical protein
VIDAFVLQNLKLSLLASGEKDERLSQADTVHMAIRHTFSEYLATKLGQRLIARFEESYPNRRLTPTKMLDLVLWQAR